jgi:hypothetical protein
VPRHAYTLLRCRRKGEKEMICPKCKKNIKGANKTKVKGVWFHKKHKVKEGKSNAR